MANVRSAKRRKVEEKSACCIELHYSIRNHRGDTDCFDLLLKQKADVNRLDENSRSPLHSACVYGCTRLVELLLQNNADVNQVDTYGRTALYIASLHGEAECVELLLRNNADVNSVKDDGNSSLHVASRYSEECVKILLDHKADVHKCNSFGKTPYNLLQRNSRFNRILLKHVASPKILVHLYKVLVDLILEYI
jgi:ankyrin repeat protein